MVIWPIALGFMGIKLIWTRKSGFASSILFMAKLPKGKGVASPVVPSRACPSETPFLRSYCSKFLLSQKCQTLIYGPLETSEVRTIVLFQMDPSLIFRALITA